MATYRSIASTEVDADSPVTSTLMQALRDNPTAIAEGQSGAPKIAEKSAFANAAAPSSNVVVAIGSGFGGVWIDYFCANSAASTRAVTIQFSTDGGSTYPLSASLFTIPVSSSGSGRVYVDFAADTIKGAISWSNGTVSFVDTTASGAIAGTDYIRIPGTTDVTNHILCNPNGGQSAT